MLLTKLDRVVAAVIGKDGRTTAMARSLAASPRIAGAVENLFDGQHRPPAAQIDAALQKAETLRPDFVVIGPVEPLAYGVVDRFAERGIPCVGPVQALAV